jgi:hypothetical protein
MAWMILFSHIWTGYSLEEPRPFVLSPQFIQMVVTIFLIAPLSALPKIDQLKVLSDLLCLSVSVSLSRSLTHFLTVRFCFCRICCLILHICCHFACSGVFQFGQYFTLHSFTEFYFIIEFTGLRYPLNPQDAYVTPSIVYFNLSPSLFRGIPIIAFALGGHVQCIRCVTFKKNRTF